MGDSVIYMNYFLFQKLLGLIFVIENWHDSRPFGYSTFLIKSKQ